MASAQPGTSERSSPSRTVNVKKASFDGCHRSKGGCLRWAGGRRLGPFRRLRLSPPSPSCSRRCVEGRGLRAIVAWRDDAQCQKLALARPNPNHDPTPRRISLAADAASPSQPPRFIGAALATTAQRAPAAQLRSQRYSTPSTCTAAPAQTSARRRRRRAHPSYHHRRRWPRRCSTCSQRATYYHTTGAWHRARRTRHHHRPL